MFKFLIFSDKFDLLVIIYFKSDFGANFSKNMKTEHPTSDFVLIIFQCLCLGDRCVFDETPMCIPGACTELAPIKNGVRSCTNSNKYGSKCTTNCNAGFVPNNTGTPKCTVSDETVKWSKKFAVCKKMNKCPKVPKSKNCAEKKYEPGDQYKS